jgi:hypothetical protein
MLPASRRLERLVMVFVGQPRRAMKKTACQTPTAMSAAQAGRGAAGAEREDEEDNRGLTHAGQSEVRWADVVSASWLALRPVHCRAGWTADRMVMASNDRYLEA